MPLRPGRQARQARAAEPGQSRHPQAGDRGRAAAAGGARRRAGGRAHASTSRRSSRGCTATPRPMPPASSSATGRSSSSCRSTAIRNRHAGDPVQHEMGRAGGPGEVRLPRPEDADRPQAAVDAPAPARRRDRPRGDPARRREDLRDARRAARRSACSRWKAGACARRWSTCGRTGSRTSSRWSRSIAPARWRTSRPIARASIGKEQPDYIHPKLEPVLRETFGVIVYQEQVMQVAQILAGYSLGEADLLRRAMGKKIKQRDGRAARPLRLRRGRARRRAGAGRRDLRLARADSPITASTRATPPPMRWSPIRPPI